MKVIPALVLLLIVISGFSQTGNSIYLKWKIQPHKTINYTTSMIEMDTANAQGPSINLGSLSKMFPDSTMKKTMDASRQIFSRLNSAAQNNEYTTILTENQPGIISVEMSLKTKADTIAGKKDTSDAGKFGDLMRIMSSGVVLRGAITEGGAIESFYLKNDQKNLLALWYELPDKPVRKGDSWPLELHLISMDQNFTCDSSFRRNRVTLADIRRAGDETIAVLSYDIEEFVSGDFKVPFGVGTDQKTTMKATYRGVSEFSMEKGRWVSYDGVLAVHSTGIMNSVSEKKFTLTAN